MTQVHETLKYCVCRDAGGAWVELARQRNALLHTSAWREFRSTLGALRTCRPLSETGDSSAARVARAATLVNLHGCLAVHCALVLGGSSGQPTSYKRKRDVARYMLCAAEHDKTPFANISKPRCTRNTAALFQTFWTFEYVLRVAAENTQTSARILFRFSSSSLKMIILIYQK